MKVICKKCGNEVSVSGLGRKPLSMSVTNACDALSLYRDVGKAAEKLHCSKAYIYKVLKSQGLKKKDIIKK